MQQILEIIRSCQGKKAFVSRELGISLKQLEQLCLECEEIQEEFDTINDFRSQAVRDMLDLRIQYGVAMGELWAIEQLTKQNVEDGAKPIPVEVVLNAKDCRKTAE